MLTRIGNFFFVACLVIIGVPAMAEEPDVQVLFQPEDGFYVGQTFQLILDIACDEIEKYPDLSLVMGDDFQVAFTGQGQFVRANIVNGKSETRKSINLSWSIVPMKAGHFDIPPLSIQTDKGPVRTNRISFSVREGGALQFFLVTTTEKGTFFVGERIPVKIELLYPSRSLNPEILDLDTNGDFPDRISMERNDSPVRVMRDNIDFWAKGVIYLVHGEEAGELVIPSMRSRVLYSEDLSRTSLLGQPETIVLESEPLALTLVNPPEKLVGTSRTTLEIVADPPRALVGDIIKVTITLTGLDNPEQAEIPVSWLEESFGNGLVWEGQGTGIVEDDRVTFHFNMLSTDEKAARKGHLKIPLTDKETGQVIHLESGPVPVELVLSFQSVSLTGLPTDGGGLLTGNGIPVFSVGELLKSRSLMVPDRYLRISMGFILFPVAVILFLLIKLTVSFRKHINAEDPEVLRKRLIRRLRQKKESGLMEIYNDLVKLKEYGCFEAPDLFSGMERDLFSDQKRGGDSERMYDDEILEILASVKGKR